VFSENTVAQALAPKTCVAELASSAVHSGIDDHPLALFEVLNFGTHGANDPCRIGPGYVRKLEIHSGDAAPDEQVEVIHRRRTYLDEDIGRGDVRVWCVFVDEHTAVAVFMEENRIHDRVVYVYSSTIQTMEINGSIALVTGSARRIGRAIALELARKGARLAIHYRASEDDARVTLNDVRRLGVDAHLFRADLVDDQARAALTTDVQERFGGLDILVNSASVFGPTRLAETTPENWDDQLDTNAKAPFFVAQAAGAMMQESGKGKIVNIVDTAGESIWPHYLPYSISKAALLGVTRGLAKSLAPEVHVNAVAPGPVQFPEHYTDAQKQKAVERTLLKRAGSADDVVRAVVFLIENDYITGEVLHVDGGRHIL
jgi:NAD(P)-dependent dehydrogenase (short-subunit alcohol dehydrogenase family)